MMFGWFDRIRKRGFGTTVHWLKPPVDRVATATAATLETPRVLPVLASSPTAVVRD